MAGMYEVVALADMKFEPVEQVYTYQCPCGDLFKIFLEELHDGEDVAPCDSCTLKIKVTYDPEDLPELRDDDGPEE